VLRAKWLQIRLRITWTSTSPWRW